MKTLPLLLLAACLAGCATDRETYWTGGGAPYRVADGAIDRARGAHEGRAAESMAVADGIAAKSGLGPYRERSLPPDGAWTDYTGQARVYRWVRGGREYRHAVREMGTVPGWRGNGWQGGTPAVGFYGWRRAEMEEIGAWDRTR